HALSTRESRCLHLPDGSAGQPRPLRGLPLECGPLQLARRFKPRVPARAQQTPARHREARCFCVPLQPEDADPSMLLTLLAVATLVIWLDLIAARGGFWLAAERDAGGPVPLAWPAVTAVVPARDEAESIGGCGGSLLGQDYAGRFSIIVVDDQSTDGTAGIARRAADAAGSPDRLAVLSGKALPRGWTGKLWAVKQGIAEARMRAP